MLIGLDAFLNPHAIYRKLVQNANLKNWFGKNKSIKMHADDLLDFEVLKKPANCRLRSIPLVGEAKVVNGCRRCLKKCFKLATA